MWFLPVNRIIRGAAGVTVTLALLFPTLSSAHASIPAEAHDRYFAILRDQQPERSGSLLDDSGPATTVPKSLSSLTVEFDMAAGDEGVLLAGGNDSELFKLYVKNGRLVWTHEYVLRKAVETISSDCLPIGHVRVRYELRPESFTAGSQLEGGKLIINGLTVHPPAENESSRIEAQHLQERDASPPQTSFTGKIRSVAFEQK